MSYIKKKIVQRVGRACNVGGFAHSGPLEMMWVGKSGPCAELQWLVNRWVFSTSSFGGDTGIKVQLV